jgi:hypothetical protein
VFPTIYFSLSVIFSGQASPCTGFSDFLVPGPSVISIGAVSEDDPSGFGYDLWSIPYSGDIASYLPVDF